MKRAKQQRLKPRNPLVVAALLKKAGAHRDKGDEQRKAGRKRENQRLRRLLASGEGAD